MRQDGAGPPRRAARAVGASRRWPLEEIDRLRAAAADGPGRAARRAAARGRAALRRALPRRGARARRRRARRRARLRGRARRRSRAGDLRRAGVAHGPRRRRLHDALAEMEVRAGRAPAAGARAGRHAASDPRAPLRGRVRLRPPGGRVPAPASARAVPARRRPPRDRVGQRPRAARCARTELDRERYLFYAAPRAPSGALVLSWRYGDEEGNPGLRSFFVEDVQRPVRRELEPRRRSLADVAWPRTTRPPRRSGSGAAALRGPRERRRRRRARRHRRRCGRLAERDALLGRRARGVTPTARCAGWSSRCCDPRRSSRTRSTMVRGSYAHARARADLRRLRERDRLGARARAQTLPDGRGDPREALHEEAARASALARRQTRVRAAVRRLEFDLLRYLRHEAEATALRAGRARAALRHAGRRAAGAAAGDARAIEHPRRDRPRRPANGHALVRDYKSGKTRCYRGGASGRTRASSRRRSTCSPCGAAGPASRSAASTSRWRGDDLRAARGGRRRARDELGDGFVRQRLRDARGARGARSTRRARRCASVVGAHARGRAARHAGDLLLGGGGCALPVDLPARARASVAASRPSSSARSSAATAPLFVHAAPAAGKTSRARRALRARGAWTTRCRWSGILAITFTEKAAAELKLRDPRAASLELGERELARDAERAWISTIHGFCSRAAAHAPARRRASTREYRVLDEPEAERLAHRRVRAGARGLPRAGHGGARARLELLAAYAPAELARDRPHRHGGCAAAASATRRCRRFARRRLGRRRGARARGGAARRPWPSSAPRSERHDRRRASSPGWSAAWPRSTPLAGAAGRAGGGREASAQAGQRPTR